MSSIETKPKNGILKKVLNTVTKPFTYTYKKGNIVTKNGKKYKINRVPIVLGSDYNLLTLNRTSKIQAKKQNFKLFTENAGLNSGLNSGSNPSSNPSADTGLNQDAFIGLNQVAVIDSNIKSSSKKNMVKTMIKTNDYFEQQPINIDNINKIIETSFVNYNNNNKRIIHNIISNILNKKTISDNEVTIINNIITKIFSGINDNSGESKLIYYSTLIFLIDKIHLIKFDENKQGRCKLKSSILNGITKENVDVDSKYIKNYINLYGNEKSETIIPQNVVGTNTGSSTGSSTGSNIGSNTNTGSNTEELATKNLSNIERKEGAKKIANAFNEQVRKEGSKKIANAFKEKVKETSINNPTQILKNVKSGGNPNATSNTPKNISNIKKDNILLIERIIMKEKYPQIDDTMNEYIKKIDKQRIVNGKKPKKNTLNYLFQVLGYYEKDSKKSVILFENYYKIIFELNIDTLKDLIPYIHIHKSNNINKENVLIISRLPNEFKKIIKEENGKYIITSNNQNYNLKNNFNILNKNLGVNSTTNNKNNL